MYVNGVDKVLETLFNIMQSSKTQKPTIKYNIGSSDFRISLMISTVSHIFVLRQNYGKEG